MSNFFALARVSARYGIRRPTELFLSASFSIRKVFAQSPNLRGDQVFINLRQRSASAKEFQEGPSCNQELLFDGREVRLHTDASSWLTMICTQAD